MSKRPPLWKVKREGKRIGSFYFTAPGGKRVNTGTADAIKANKFEDRWLAKIAAAAQKTEVQGAAAATIAALDATPDMDPPASDPPPPPDLPAAGGVAPEPIAADHYLPPPGDTGDWAGDAARAAAGGSEGAAASRAPQVDPQFLDEIIDQAAVTLVELQIAGQDWAIKRGLKIKAGGVDGDSKSRAPGVALWKGQLRKWMPTDIDAPEWLLAIIITAATTVPIQIANATPLPKEDKKADDAQAAATSGAVGVAA